ncbi:hypothetical protein [Streptacidiphilus sp. MAP5-52]|uniref:hypothetical protein n=1 Tax=Streptacidiphilus sp. MAP5-52 TaxID=3156267 RepID=UPI003515AAA6
MAANAALVLRPLPAQWTPPSTWERYIPAPTPARPDTRDRKGYEAAAVYVLDLAGRELSVMALDSDTISADTQTGEHLFTDHFSKGLVPPRIRLGTCLLRYEPDLASAEVLNALLAEAEPLARQLLDNLIPVPGTGQFDWTPAAMDAAQRAGHLIERRPYRGTKHDFPYRSGRQVLEVNASDLFRVWPELVQEEWAERTGKQLAYAVENVHTEAYRAWQEPQLRKRLWDILGDGDLDKDAALTVVGVRAWMHGFRQQKAGDLVPVDAEVWDGIAVHALHIRDDSTVAERQRVERRAVDAAAAVGVKLLGVTEWSTDQLRQRRAEIRAELEELGARIGELEKDLKPAKALRRAKVSRVLAWQEYGDTDSAVGRLAGLSHTAVGALREVLEKDDEESE